MRRILILAVLVTTMIASFQVSAEEGATYIYSGTTKDAAKTTLQMLTGKSISNSELFALPNVELPVLDDMWFVGARETNMCDPAYRVKLEEVSGGEIDQLIELAEHYLVNLNQERAAENLDLLRGAIPCSTVVLTRAELAKIFFLLGANSVFKMELEEVSRAYFHRAIVLGGRPDWDNDYPPMVHSVYERASTDATAHGIISIDYHLAGLDLAMLRLDGEDLSVEGDVSGSVRALPGMHVIQWKRGEAGEIKTRVVEVPKHAHLVSTEGLQSILAMRPEVGKDSSIGLVQETFLSRQGGKVSILIVEETDETDDFSYTYHRVRESDDLKPISYLMGKPQDLTVRQYEVRYKPLEFRVGGGYVFERSFAGTFDFNFWLNKGFGLQFGVDVAFMTHLGLTAEDNRVWIMPSLRGGARLEFRHDRLVKPYVLVLGRVSFQKDPNASAGPMVGGGATFMTSSESQKTQIFGVALEIGGGPMFSSNETSLALWATVNIVFREFEVRD